MLTLADTTLKIESTMEAIQEATEEYARRLKAQTESEADWKLAKAKGMLETRDDPTLKSADMREAWVLQTYSKEYELFLLEQARCEAQKQRLVTLRDVLSGVQSLQRVFTI
jgi:hypothetical protein